MDRSPDPLPPKVGEWGGDTSLTGFPSEPVASRRAILWRNYLFPRTDREDVKDVLLSFVIVCVTQALESRVTGLSMGKALMALPAPLPQALSQVRQWPVR